MTNDAHIDDWTLRGVYDGDRLQELKDLYQELGFKVLVMPMMQGAAPGCGECFNASPGSARVLYTKKIDSGTD